MTKIFISYSSTDAAFADEYYNELVHRAHEVWMDRAELKGGQEWVKVIQERIRWSEAMIVLWSAGALASAWVEMEMTYAHTLKKKIIPVQIDATSPQEHMIVNARQVIDGRHKDRQEVVNQIEESIRRDNRRPITTHTPPVESERAPQGPAKVSRLKPRWLIAGAAVVLIGIVGLTIALSGPGSIVVTETVSPQTTAAPTNTTVVTPAVTLPPNALDQPASLDLLNVWRASSGMPALAVNPALQAIADEHVSYLRSLPLPELESTNMFRNADGQDVIFMADSAGYSGEVLMIVEATDADFTLQHLLSQLDDQARFADAGFSQVRSIATSKLYFVLILGTGG